MKILLSETAYKKAKLNIFLENVDLSTFVMQDELNPDIFDPNEKMKKEIRKKLLKIGKDFFDFMKIEWVDLKDIQLTGSLANYNWSKFSDVDLHIIIPYNQISKNEDLVEEFAWSKKELWNDEHDIKIKEYEVELYAQDVEADLVAGGIYSVLYNKWIKKPSKEDVNLNKKEIERIVAYFEKEIEKLIRQFLSGNCYGLTDSIDDLKSDIRDLRKNGLSKGGEFSSENIAFKALRRMGLLDKMNEMKKKIYDDSLSVEKSDEEKLEDGDFIPKKKDTPISRATKQDEESPEVDDKGDKGKGQWLIQGIRYKSIRDAEDAIGVPKSTIEYRANSPNYPSWQNLSKK